MEKAVDQLFTEEVKKEILSRLQLDPEMKKLGDFENYVFEVYQKGVPQILRVTHSSHRSKEELESELDWIQYLHRNGIHIPNVIESAEGHTVEAFKAGDTHFFASLFEKAAGSGVKAEEAGKEMIIAWGKMIGKMHRITKDYTPPAGIKPRYQWTDNDLLDFEKYFDGEDAHLLEHAREIVRQIGELPANRESFGLIHSDIHLGNFFYDGKEIHVFDFDDACYHYFASDIAIPLYYTATFRDFKGTRAERTAYAKEFMDAFLSGYREENDLPAEYLAAIPLFLKLRDIDLYAVLNKKVAPEDRTERVKEWMLQIKERMEKNEALVDLDFALV
ncbi:phosphotransferase enzyme family protein [Heyndrickxia acidicola]|uniref:Phosphotransferase n=1 Tax=Heyndrickxia acidicola TaxID=209389 RepID=A0ABU6MIA1_9BACI|nr:phosphotransferase [Heyndrickxia acidicola]MED1204391.1 phosphotransferase [Heyndrickxia acidicola]